MGKETKSIIFLAVLFFLCVAMVIGSYIYNFSDNSVSSTPSDWGGLGDYFGGVLNPLISAITLYFLIKTYLSQKKEIIQGQLAADEQRRIAQTTTRIQLLNTKISTAYETIALYRGEMEGITNAMANDRRYTSMYGDEYGPDSDQKKYRVDMACKIKVELKKIDIYLDEIKSLSE